MSFTVTSPAPDCYIVRDPVNRWDVYEYKRGAPFTKGPWWECPRCMRACAHIEAAKKYKEERHE